MLSIATVLSTLMIAVQLSAGEPAPLFHLTYDDGFAANSAR